MAGQKRFTSSLFGFKKSTVNLYIQEIVNEFSDQMKEKDDEILLLKAKIKELESRYTGTFSKVEKVNEDRIKIADVLIKAQEQADLILYEARMKREEEFRESKMRIEEEQQKLNSLREQKRMELTDIKEDIKTVKKVIAERFKKYQDEIEEMEEMEEFIENSA